MKLRNIFLFLSFAVFCFSVGFKTRDLKEYLSKSPANLGIIGIDNSKKPNLNFNLFWDVWGRIDNYYLDKKAIDPKKMFYGAISGMVSSLGDPYTVFLPPEQNKDAKDDLGGKFEGIGAQLGVKDKKIVVIAPLKGSPAESAGLKAGDWIIKVDGKETLDWTINEAVSKIRGPKGSKVTLTVMKKDSQVGSPSAELSIKRDEIKVASVEMEIKEHSRGKVIYLKLSRFGDQTNDEWTGTVNRIVNLISSDDSLKGMILDLRNNPGGYLTGSVFIASEFLTDGTVVIQESTGGIRKNYDVNRKGKLLNIPLVVLINKGSASASEIVAGALKDRNRAKLVGETTFGKGSIQEAQELSEGAGIHITTAKWLIPSGKWINGTGIDPDEKVVFDESKPETDNQLEKAIEILVK